MGFGFLQNVLRHRTHHRCRDAWAACLGKGEDATELPLQDRAGEAELCLEIFRDGGWADQGDGRKNALPILTIHILRITCDERPRLRVEQSTPPSFLVEALIASQSRTE